MYIDIARRTVETQLGGGATIIDCLTDTLYGGRITHGRDVVGCVLWEEFVLCGGQLLGCGLAEM